MICINLEDFILECKLDKQRKADRIKCNEEMYATLHKEACLHASYGDMYKPKSFLFWKLCPVCDHKLDVPDYFYKVFGMPIVTIHICTKCNYRYVHDTGLFEKELEVCKEKG